MQFAPDRVQNPATMDGIAALIATHGRAVVQFTDAAAYSPALLHDLNEVCKLSPDSLQVRFYGCSDGGFDAQVLRHLPDVKNLSLDNLRSIHGEDALRDLAQLTRLNFSVYEQDRPDILSCLPLAHLTDLAVGGQHKPNLDISPLAGCTRLARLSMDQPGKGAEALQSLPALQEITLRSFPKSAGLGFLNAIAGLRRVKLILGGRADLADFAHPGLEMLQVIRVKSLQTLGDLARFPALRHLQVEDQVQVTSLDLRGVSLARLRVSNCKSLDQLTGLAAQTELQEFAAARVALNMNALRDFDWPASTKVVGLFTGSTKWNAETKAHLAAKGYAQFGQFWA